MDLKTKLANEYHFYQSHYALNDNYEVILKSTGDKPASRIDRYGYRVIGIKLYHRIVYALYYCELDEFLDHKDRVKTNNAPDNLRSATPSQNLANTARVSPTTGYKGVRFDTRSKVNPYVAQHGSIGNIYPCDDPIDAAIAYDIHAYALHGEYACTNADMGLYGEDSAIAKQMIVDAFKEPKYKQMAFQLYCRQLQNKPRKAATLPNTIGVKQHGFMGTGAI